jgi:hypothetical protein
VGIWYGIYWVVVVAGAEVEDVSMRKVEFIITPRPNCTTTESSVTGGVDLRLVTEMTVYKCNMPDLSAGARPGTAVACTPEFTAFLTLTTTLCYVDSGEHLSRRCDSCAGAHGATGSGSANCSPARGPAYYRWARRAREPVPDSSLRSSPKGLRKRRKGSWLSDRCVCGHADSTRLKANGAISI